MYYVLFSENWIDMWSWKTTNTKISSPGVSRLAKLPIGLMMSESDPRFHSRFLNAVQFHFSTCNFHQVVIKTTFKRSCMYLQGYKDWFRSSVESFLSNGKYLAIYEHQHKESYSCIMCIFMTLFASWHMTFLPRLSGRHQIGKRSCWEYSHIFVHSPVLSELCFFVATLVCVNTFSNRLISTNHITRYRPSITSTMIEPMFGKLRLRAFLLGAVSQFYH